MIANIKIVFYKKKKLFRCNSLIESYFIYSNFVLTSIVLEIWRTASFSSVYNNIWFVDMTKIVDISSSCYRLKYNILVIYIKWHALFTNNNNCIPILNCMFACIIFWFLPSLIRFLKINKFLIKIKTHGFVIGSTNICII